MKFGGTSVADAERIHAVGRIVGGRRERQPVVVVSALAGVTDCLEQALAVAREGDLEGLDPLLADLERRHRWALSGSIETASARHDLSLELDRRFEELRGLLRSIRILGEGTPRAADAILGFGELCSARLIATALAEMGLPAVEVDAREVMVTDASHGAAEPVLASTAEQAERQVRSRIDTGEIPVMAGFVGRGPTGAQTTLGRGGSDTSAAVLGMALGADEIQIWTDVDGLMSADPRRVAAARTLDRVSFAEAAELAYYGARVLHPASIAPAVRRNIPVRVLNSMRPEGAGTLIEEGSAAPGSRLASLASRGPVATLRVTSRRLSIDPDFTPRVLTACRRLGRMADLVVASEVAVTLVVPDGLAAPELERELGAEANVEQHDGRAIVCAVGAALERPDVRARVLAALAAWEPELVALGAARTSAAAVIPEAVLDDALVELHRQFFEQEALA